MNTDLTGAFLSKVDGLLTEAKIIGAPEERCEDCGKTVEECDCGEAKSWYFDVETKTRHVRDARFWGKPVGTPITPGMKPVSPSAVRKPNPHIHPALQSNVGRRVSPAKAPKPSKPMSMFERPEMQSNGAWYKRGWEEDSRDTISRSYGDPDDPSGILIITEEYDRYYASASNEDTNQSVDEDFDDVDSAIEWAENAAARLKIRGAKRSDTKPNSLDARHREIESHRTFRNQDTLVRDWAHDYVDAGHDAASAMKNAKDFDRELNTFDNASTNRKAWIAVNVLHDRMNDPDTPSGIKDMIAKTLGKKWMLKLAQNDPTQLPSLKRGGKFYRDGWRADLSSVEKDWPGGKASISSTIDGAWLAEVHEEENTFNIRKREFDDVEKAMEWSDKTAITLKIRGARATLPRDQWPQSEYGSSSRVRRTVIVPRSRGANPKGKTTK